MGEAPKYLKAFRVVFNIIKISEDCNCRVFFFFFARGIACKGGDCCELAIKLTCRDRNLEEMSSGTIDKENIKTTNQTSSYRPVRLDIRLQVLCAS